MKPLNVFWIDDQHEDMVSFKVQAEQYGILLHPYTSAEEGLPALEARLDFFDAVLFDALFFQRKDQVSGTEEVDGLSVAIAKMNQLKHRKAYTPFILTGQERLDGDKTFRATFGEFYSKRNPEDVKRLFKDIRLTAEAMADTQIRHRYHRIFEICTERYIGEAAAKHLLTILRNVNGADDELKDDLYFNHLRKCLEWMFRRAHALGMIHDACIERNEVNLTACSRFMAGLDNERLQVGNSTSHFPPMVAEHVRRILDLTNAFSHTEGEDKEKSKLQLESYRDSVRSPYLLFSLTFQLMDVLLWFKAYADINGDVETNKAQWVVTAPELDDSELVHGRVTRLHPEKLIGEFTADGDGTKAFLSSDLVRKHSLERDVRIAVATRPSAKGPVVSHLKLLL